MSTCPNWLKIIGLLFIGIVIATTIKILGVVLLNEAASYVFTFIVMVLLAYLTLTAHLLKLKKFVSENRVIAAVIVADFSIRTIATSAVFPDIFPSLSLYMWEEIPLIGLLIHTLVLFTALPIAFALITLDYYFSYRICIERNRDPIKGIVATFLGFPFTPLILWLALKTRDPKTRQLS